DRLVGVDRPATWWRRLYAALMPLVPTSREVERRVRKHSAARGRRSGYWRRRSTAGQNSATPAPRRRRSPSAPESPAAR
ncbi:hypothetical protein, partial [Gordonia aichiensis]